MSSAQRRRVAVVGSGVAGLTAAYVAAKSADVTLFEADDRLGGHADTHQVGDLAIDTGFIVHNERTYPTLLRLFAELGIETQDSEMSMSVYDPAAGVQYAGALGPRGLFPTPGSLLDRRHLQMLAEIPRFHRLARRHLQRAAAADGFTGRVSNLPVRPARNAGQASASAVKPWGKPPHPSGTPSRGAALTLRGFLHHYGFSDTFGRHFAEPLVAAVWSCEPAKALDYPAAYLFTFLDHHGMLGIFGSPRWKTVVGGSRTYVAKVAATLPDVRLATPVRALTETATGIELTTDHGTETFDAAIVATHPDQALALLANPTELQRSVLGAISYSPNRARLHTDTSLLPPAERARGSWNFLRPPTTPGRGNDPVTVTYDLTRLMRLPVPADGTRYLVTLGGDDLIDPARVIDTMDYAHPLYTPASVAAQARLPEIDTDRLAFAGAYHGWGFHEDGARSGLRAAERLGLPWRRTPDAPPPTPRIYTTTVRHTRRAPMKRSFRHTSTMWLVDLDRLPDNGRLARFEARDHLGDPTATIKSNVLAFLATHGVDLTATTGAVKPRILMAAHPRAWGYCFNPISVFWCWSGEGRLAAVVVEVHNTYGDREAYLVHPDPAGRARTPKSMYVSPFHGVDGDYELAVPVPGERLHIAVSLHTEGPTQSPTQGHSRRTGKPADIVFSASLDGRDPVAAEGAAVRRAARGALTGSLWIRAHGIWLWARGLPVQPRPTHQAKAGVWPEKESR